MTNPPERSGGFSLTELIVVIAIAAILAAVAVTKISTKGFDTEGYANRAAAMVRYAQKLAISQRRDVFVVVCTTGDSGSACLNENKLRLCYADATCGSAVHEPPGTNAFSYKVPSGVVLAGTTFSFNSLGTPSTGANTLTVTGDGTKTITIAAETGYVQYVP